MPSPKIMALGTAAGAVLALLAVVPTFAQPGPPSAPSAVRGGAVFDPAQLPETRGTVGRYTLTPRGDVDGFMLEDGTQVQVPPHLAAQLVFVARPGDAVSVRGLRALGSPLVAAAMVRNDASGLSVVDVGGGPRGAAQRMDASGTVQSVLRGRRGEVNGVILADGSTLRMPPHVAERYSELLRAGQTIAARGEGMTTPFGRVLDVWAIGAAPDRLTEIERRGPPDDRQPGPPDERRPGPPRPPRG